MAELEKVITALEFCNLSEDCRGCVYFTDTLKGKCKCNADALELLKDRRWIPVSERLPKSMENRVIVYLQHEDYAPYIGYGHYEKFLGEEMWYDLENNTQFSKRGYTVTHWMAMPDSPEGETLALS